MCVMIFKNGAFMTAAVFFAAFFMYCDNSTEEQMSKSDFVGWWSETDTLPGAQTWVFTDSIVGHGFLGLDTCGGYDSWQVHENTLLLYSKNGEFIITYECISKEEVNFMYDCWQEPTSRTFSKLTK